MLVDWIYGVPTWEMAVVVVGGAVGLSLLGLVATTRVLHVELRRRHNEFTGFNSALIGVVFAVLLAFIAVEAWESFGKAGDTAQIEASLTGDLFRDAATMPEPARTELVGDIRDYVEIVLSQEWPVMARGALVGDAGWAPLFKFHQALRNVDAANPVQVAMVAETLRRLNALYDARQKRLLAAEDHIAPAVWWVVLLGAGVVIGLTYLFGMESFAMHALMTGMVAASLALVIVLIVAFDYPFRGEVQVGPDGFRNVQHLMEQAGVKFSHNAEGGNAPAR
jgi:Protein of unknown function (DUF4239)